MGISKNAYHTHLVRQAMLGRIISELLEEIKISSEKITLLERSFGKKKQYDKLMDCLSGLAESVKHSKLEQPKIPILQKISQQIRYKRLCF